MLEKDQNFTEVPETSLSKARSVFSVTNLSNSVSIRELPFYFLLKFILFINCFILNNN
jgi:hypothetical protein